MWVEQGSLKSMMWIGKDLSTTSAGNILALRTRLRVRADDFPQSEASAQVVAIGIDGLDRP
jgi:hypothetical protein